MNDCRTKSLVLIGFMGAGKTTVGKLVADKLNRRFLDTDDVIEKEFDMPVSQIFAEFGETTFRERELSLITNLCQEENLVLSLGGGAFLQEEIRKVCLSSSMVFFLELSFEAWKERFEQIIDTRPVLKGKSIEEIEELFKNRMQIYANHHLKIETDHKTPEVIANEIIMKIKE